MEKAYTFVRNGPLLEFSVNREPMGSELVVRSGDRVSIEASVRLNPDLEVLDRLELIVHGDVVKTAKSREGQEVISLQWEGHHALITKRIKRALDAYDALSTRAKNALADGSAEADEHQAVPHDQPHGDRGENSFVDSGEPDFVHLLQ